MDPIPKTPLDPLLNRLYTSRGLYLELRPDAPAEIRTPSGIVMDDLIPADRLTEMLAAVTPPERWDELQSSGRTEFDLDMREGIFRFYLRRSPEGVRATISGQHGGRRWPVGSRMPSSRFPTISGLLAFMAIAVMAVLLVTPLLFHEHPGMSLQMQSMNNVKQLTLAVIQYSQDYDYTLPGWVRNPDGRYAHNTWDEQINVQVKSKDIFTNGRPGIKSPSDPTKQRILTYAINGALIAPYDAHTGEVNWTAVPAANGPRQTLLGPSSIRDPAGTILVAEVATEAPPPTTPDGAAWPRPADGLTEATPGKAWLKAYPKGDSAANAVIDISPRTWVSGGANTSDDWYNSGSRGFTRFTRNGVARDLYSGGGAYGFVDGHVRFMKIAATTGIGEKNENGDPVTADNWFKASNKYNMWNPAR